MVAVLFVLWPAGPGGNGPVYDLKRKIDSAKESALSTIASLPSFGAGSPGEDDIVHMNVTEARRQYDRSVVAWEEEYEGKKVAISGVVASVGLVDAELLRRVGLKADYYGYVGLAADDGSPLPSISFLLPAGELLCTFHKRDREEFAKLRRGHIVKVTGVSRPGSQGAPTFRDCHDVQVTGTYISPR